MEFKVSKPLGKILKTHGKQGELIISCQENFPEDFQNMGSLFIEINEGVVPFFLERVLTKTLTTAIIKLEDVDTLEEARELTGLRWHLPAETTRHEPSLQLPELEQLTGFTLIDQHGQEIGVIEGYKDIPSNTLLEVRHQGNINDIPLNEETVHYLDPEKKIIKIEIPEGLLDL